jgi:hypothetical protein
VLKEERVLRARIGGFAKAARYPRDELTSAARAGFLARFLRQVDEADPSLPEEERLRRADLLLKAHMTRMALISAQRRRNGGSSRR